MPLTDSWIQLSAVLVNMFKQMEFGALVADPMTQEIIHSMGTLFVDDTDLYTWKDGLLNPGELWVQTQLELTQWSTLLNAEPYHTLLQQGYDFQLKKSQLSYKVLPTECETLVDFLLEEPDSFMAKKFRNRFRLPYPSYKEFSIKLHPTIGLNVGVGTNGMERIHCQHSCCFLEY